MIAFSRDWFQFWAALPLLALALPTAWGQDSGYQVEVLAFRHVDPSTGGELFFQADEDYGVGDGAIALWGDEPEAVPGYAALGDEDMRMRVHVRQLRASPYYHPVAHVLWRQPALANPRKVRLEVPSELCEGVREIDGAMRVRNLGELAFEFDLSYVDCALTQLSGQEAKFRINGAPKVLFNRTYYFDHPLLGVLLEVRRDR